MIVEGEMEAERPAWRWEVATAWVGDAVVQGEEKHICPGLVWGRGGKVKYQPVGGRWGGRKKEVRMVSRRLGLLAAPFLAPLVRRSEEVWGEGLSWRRL